MADLQQRYLNILKMPRQAVSSIPTFGALTTGTTETSTLSKILKGLLYLFLFLFVLFCILMIVNYMLIYYKKEPLFDYKTLVPYSFTTDSPSQSDWKKYWITDLTDANPEIASYNYTLIFDTIILNDKDFDKRRPNMLFYRKTSPIADNDFTEFLTDQQEIVTENSPHLYVTYNAHKSEIHIVIKLKNNENKISMRTLEIPIISQQQYRIAVNISQKLIEVYKDGVWLKTVVTGKDGLPTGSTADKFIYTPNTDTEFVRVRNLMLITPMTTSGIIRSMGTAAINLDDLKKEQASNICSP